jgi:hypothetical protein
MLRDHYHPNCARHVRPIVNRVAPCQHSNSCPELAGYLRRDNDERRTNGQSEHGARLLADDLLERAIVSGWGTHSSAEQVRSTGAVSNYFVDIAKHGHEHAHELAKLTQLPLNAPRHFRRLRAGKGFLPPVHKNPDWTGALVRRYYDPVLGYTAEALKGKSNPNPERLEQLRLCERIEEREFIDELTNNALQLSESTRLPPVTYWTQLEGSAEDSPRQPAIFFNPTLHFPPRTD